MKSKTSSRRLWCAESVTEAVGPNPAGRTAGGDGEFGEVPDGAGNLEKCDLGSGRSPNPSEGPVHPDRSHGLVERQSGYGLLGNIVSQERQNIVRWTWIGGGQA